MNMTNITYDDMGSGMIHFLEMDNGTEPRLPTGFVVCNQVNTALWSMLLCVGTICVAVILRKFRQSRFLGKQVYYIIYDLYIVYVHCICTCTLSMYMYIVYVHVHCLCTCTLYMYMYMDIVYVHVHCICPWSLYMYMDIVYVHVHCLCTWTLSMYMYIVYVIIYTYII